MLQLVGGEKNNHMLYMSLLCRTERFTMPNAAAAPNHEIGKAAAPNEAIYCPFQGPTGK